MPIKKIKLNNNRAIGQIQRESVSIEKRTVPVVWGTEYSGVRYTFDGPYNELLSMEERHVNLGRLRNKGPVLKDHISTTGNVVGVIEEAGITSDRQGTALLRIRKNAEGDDLLSAVADGMINNISIGYRIYEMEDVTQKGDAIPTYRATNWEPHEISFVAVGFDPNARVSRGQDNNNTYECLLRTLEEPKMDEETETIPKPAITQAAKIEETKRELAPDPKALQDKAIESERQRSLAISAMVREANQSPVLAEQFITQGTPVESARSLLGALSAKLSTEKETHTSSVRQSVEIATDERDTAKESLLSALLYKDDPSRELEKRANEYVGLTLFEIARMFDPRKNDYGSRSKIASRALSDSDMGIVLGQFAQVKLKEAYNYEGIKTFMPFCTKGTLPNYKEATEVSFNELATPLSQVGPGEEYSVGSFGSSDSEKTKVLKYGKLFVITEELIVDDSLDVISRFYSGLGSLAAQKEEELVYEQLKNPSLISLKGQPFYSKENKNISNGPTYVCDRAFDDMTEDMKSHYLIGDGGTKRRILVNPKFVIAGPLQQRYLKRYLYVTYKPTEEKNVKFYQNSFIPIISQEIDTLDWYCVADPTFIPTIKYLYLEGSSGGPELTYKKGFEVDGVTTKIRHVFGAKALEYRSIYKNIGARPDHEILYGDMGKPVSVKEKR